MHHKLNSTSYNRAQYKFPVPVQLIPYVNPLTPNGHYSGRTAPLTSRRCILNIYSSNIRTEYYKTCCIISVFLSSKCRLFNSATLFGSCIIHILNTGVLKFKRKFQGQRVNLCIHICGRLYTDVLHNMETLGSGTGIKKFGLQCVLRAILGTRAMCSLSIALDKLNFSC
jgi:hypothetical protein